ncbi:MAG: DUF615 domain-containing protein [Desulfovibrionaceae bacterium]|nr:DUF615 domain-containing protein [Desulfovibrionaceae bacterium]
MVRHTEKRAREEDKPSRSAKKREAKALQTLGEELTHCTADILASLPLPPELTNAIADYANLSTHEAKRRQRQYIGRLMREADPELIEKIQRAVQKSS